MSPFNPSRRRSVATAVLSVTVAVTATMPTRALSATSRPSPTVVRSTHAVASAVDRFRSLLGPDNGGAPGGDPAGRREIKWDGVPDEFAEPNAYVGDFFNADTAPRARGAILASPGGRLAVSAKPQNPAGVLPDARVR